MTAIPKGSAAPTRSAAMSSSQQNLQTQLAAISSSPDGLVVRNGVGSLLTDPAVAALVQIALQMGGSNLTEFQKSLLAALPILGQDPSLVTTVLAGTTPTATQRRSARSILRQLRHNAAYQQLLLTADQLAKETDAMLAGYVSQVVTNKAKALPTPLTALGNPTYDAIVTNFANVRNSAAFGNVSTALTPLLQSPDFLPYLQNLQAPDGLIGGILDLLFPDNEPRDSLIVTFIPGHVVAAMLLPSETDPPVNDIVTAIILIIGAIAGICAAIIGLLIIGTIAPPALLATVAILGIVAAAAGLIGAINALYDALVASGGSGGAGG
ncbi:MAG: hypothetical protein ACREM8_00660 [Vulcanimicrobiaceae bacterium]